MTTRATVHKNFCDYEVANAKARNFYRGGSIVKKAAPARYSNYELREMFLKEIKKNS